MRENLSPWIPAIMCGGLSLITLVADIFGNVGLSTFLCFLPMCFFKVGEMHKKLHDENRELKRRLDEMLLKDDEASKKVA